MNEPPETTSLVDRLKPLTPDDWPVRPGQFFGVIDRVKNEERLVRSDGVCAVIESGKLLAMAERFNYELVKEHEDEESIEFLVVPRTPFEAYCLHLIIFVMASPDPKRLLEMVCEIRGIKLEPRVAWHSDVISMIDRLKANQPPEHE